MAWNNVVIPMIRNLVNDVDVVQLYTDARLTDLALVAAQFVLGEVTFSQTYTVNIVALSISPDPTILPDNNYMNLTALKAAVLLINAEARTYSRMAITIKDGASTIDASKGAAALEIRAKHMNDMYETAKIRYMLNDGNAGKAVLTPYTNIQYGYSTNDAYFT